VRRQGKPPSHSILTGRLADRFRRIGAVHRPLFFFQRRTIAAAALEARLPTIYAIREAVDDGGLISYGINLVQNFRRAADYVVKILKGAKPGDLPVEFPTKLELVINLPTARMLGLTVPPTLLATADEVIE
jgi:putative ABC transport system substrate-binding protein